MYKHLLIATAGSDLAQAAPILQLMEVLPQSGPAKCPSGTPMRVSTKVSNESGASR